MHFLTFFDTITTSEGWWFYIVYSEKEYKNLEEKYKQQIQKLQKENEIKTKEVNLLKKQNKEKDEVIHDLDPNNYRGRYQTAMQENYELKKN